MALGPIKEVSAQKLARGLALFSFALGAGVLLAPKMVASLGGIKIRRTFLMRLFGLRR